MAAQHYDAVVIGAGQAGVPLSQALARSGRRTALIEREHVGGTCINEGCTLTKTMVASAKTAYVDRRSADYGVHNGSVAVDMPEVRGRKRAMVDSFRNSNLRRIEATDGLDLIAGDRVRHRVVARCRGAHTGSAARGDHALRHLARHRRPRARRRRSGIQLDVGALLAPGGAALASVPVFLFTLLLVRGLPAILYRPVIGTRGVLAAALLQATSLPFIVAATGIGMELGILSPATGAALVVASLLSVVLFPVAALTLLRGDKRPSAQQR